MTKIIEGLHYGRIQGTHYVWLSVRPYYWKINKTVLKQQHKKHYFQDNWIKKGNIVTVKDTPQNNAVYVTDVFNSNSINNTASVNPVNELKPVLRAKCTETKKYKSLKHVLKILESAIINSLNKKQPNDNAILVSYQHPEICQYAELEDGKINTLGQQFKIRSTTSD